MQAFCPVKACSPARCDTPGGSGISLLLLQPTEKTPNPAAATAQRHRFIQDFMTVAPVPILVPAG
ncbi:MAG: hypothetical protein AMXMBFR34_49250 [Myxococcaceae bacterium]